VQLNLAPEQAFANNQFVSGMIASLGRLMHWLPQLRSRTVITSDGPIRLREVPEPREWLLDRAALDDIVKFASRIGVVPGTITADYEAFARHSCPGWGHSLAPLRVQPADPKRLYSDRHGIS
jgi:hypothetical protein